MFINRHIACTVIYILIKLCVFFFQKKTDMVGVVDVVELCETVSEIVLKGSKNVSVHS